MGESDGTVILRIGVISGTLADDIQVRLYTEDDTAQGEIYGSFIYIPLTT